MAKLSSADIDAMQKRIEDRIIVALRQVDVYERERERAQVDVVHAEAMKYGAQAEVEVWDAIATQAGLSITLVHEGTKKVFGCGY